MLKFCKRCNCDTERSKHGQCKQCKARWNTENKDKNLKYQAKYCAANQEKVRDRHAKYCEANPDKRRATFAKWRAANPDKVREQKSKYYEDNREKLREYAAKWHAENPEKSRIQSLNRRARKRAGGGKLSQGLAERLFELQRGKCACCKQPLGDDYHLDHIMPLALGGSNTDDNIQLLRSTCNQQKKAKHPADFMRQRGFLI